MANAVDSKSTDSDILRVQVPFWAPFIYQKPRSCGFFIFTNTLCIFIII